MKKICVYPKNPKNLRPILYARVGIGYRFGRSMSVIPTPTFVRVNSFRWESTSLENMDSRLRGNGNWAKG